MSAQFAARPSLGILKVFSCKSLQHGPHNEQQDENFDLEIVAE